jgi:DNA polymerase bacteriophage-type
MITLRIDLETYSDVDLKKCGVHKYVESSDFQIMLFGYAFDDQPAQVVDLARGEQLPTDVLEALHDADVSKAAYNAAFELACLNRHFGKTIPTEQWRCTSVHALYLGLPGSLAEVGRVMGLSDDKQKLGSGWALIRYFCIPCKPTKANHGRTRNLPQHDPAKWDLFVEYCRRDVETEREVARKLVKFPVPEIEWKLWHLDQRMMNRGVRIDRTLVTAAIEADNLVRERLTNEAVQLTGLDNPNSRDQLLAWLQEEMEDDEIADLTKKTVPKLLEATDSETVERVLRIRQELAKTSVSKYHAMARAMCADDCIRGLTQFYGANRTGRWAGRIVQVQNLPQNKLKDLALARDLIKARRFDELEMLFGSMADTLSQLIRTAFIARSDSRFIPVDFSAIEARVIAWLAWCSWRLEVFKTHGKIYEASAEQMFKLPPGSVTKKSPYRQKGKIAELALGYQGGAGALKTMGALEMGIPEDELDDIKVAWREANDEIVQLWYAVERCAKEAVRAKARSTMPIAAGRAKLVFSYESGFLFVTLPSGRRLAYVKPRIEGEDLYRESSKGVRYIVAQAGSLTYEGQDQKTKQWTRLASYGGKLVENITQAIARDCLREAMLALDDSNIEQLFTVHDEVVTEVPHGMGELAEVEEIMGRPLAWAPDLPLRGDGFETEYYMKEID